MSEVKPYTGLDVARLTFLPAKYYTPLAPSDKRGIDLIVLHSMEAPEKGETAENCARYFQTLDRPASAHFCVDNNSIVKCVRERDIAYAAPGANHHGLHIEHAGYARQSADDWLDTYSAAMLKLSAQLTAKLCLVYGIPAAWLSRESLALGRRGITSHNNVTQWQKSLGKPGTHTDPGAGFPWRWYVDLVKAELSALKSGVKP